MEHSFVFGATGKSGGGMLLPAERHVGCLEMLYVRRGSVTVKTAMCDFRAGTGDIFFLAPDMVRTVSAQGGDAAVESIWFSISFFEDLPEAIDRDLFYMFLVQSRTRENLYSSGAPLYHCLKDAFETCYEEYLTRDLCYCLRIRGRLYLMMAQLISSYGATRENDRMVYHNVLRLRDSLTYIDLHFRERITVPDLAAYLQVTPDYYTKLFRDSIGKTTVDYVNSVRLNRGMMLLSETELPVSEIASDIGFASGNYFSKMFRAVLGLTPLAFRRGARR